MTRLYVLCGLPFAGKSTLGRAIAAHTGAALVEVDAVNGERGVGLDGGPIPREAWIVAYRASYKRLEAWLGGGRSVVFDATSFRRVQRERLRRSAARCGAAVTLVWVDTPVADVERRRRENRRAPTRPDVRDEDFAQVVEGFQPPGDDEDAVRYDPTMPLAAWLDRLPPPDAAAVAAERREDRA